MDIKLKKKCLNGYFLNMMFIVCIKNILVYYMNIQLLDLQNILLIIKKRIMRYIFILKEPFTLVNFKMI